MLLAVIPLVEEPINPRYCPLGAASAPEVIGYVHVVKDGYRIAGGKGYYDRGTTVLNAWFPSERSAMVAITLDLRGGLVRIHTEGKGSIRMHHGIFCAFSN